MSDVAETETTISETRFDKRIEQGLRATRALPEVVTFFDGDAMIDFHQIPYPTDEILGKLTLEFISDMDEVINTRMQAICKIQLYMHKNKITDEREPMLAALQEQAFALSIVYYQASERLRS